MTAENYKEILEDVCEKIKAINAIKEIDISEIKSSVESIENLVTDTQAKLNFQEIKEKLESIAFNIDSCNEAFIKNLYTDINELKSTFENVTQYLENIQNTQNLSLTSAEFEEYQKQQLDLALKTQENIFQELAEIKANSKVTESAEEIDSIHGSVENLHKKLIEYIEQLNEKTANIPDLSNISTGKSVDITETNEILKHIQSDIADLQGDIKSYNFAEQLSKIGAIYESLTIVQAWVEKVGFINKSIENLYSKIGDTTNFTEAFDDFSAAFEKINVAVVGLESTVSVTNEKLNKAIYAINEKLGLNVDFDDISSKIDIVYENLSALNEWVIKVDNIDLNLREIQAEINGITEGSNTIKEIQAKINEVLPEDFDASEITSKVDIIYDNLTAINEWAGKIDSIEETLEKQTNLFGEKFDVIQTAFEKVDNKFEESNNKITEIKESLENSIRLLEELPKASDKINEISSQLQSSLMEVSSDFLRLHKYVEDNTKLSVEEIESLKARFDELNNDISSISQRTNKLILTADDANKEFKTHLEVFKDLIDEFNKSKLSNNDEVKFTILGEKLNKINDIMQNSLEAGQNLNNAFVYLGEWADASGTMLQSIKDEIAEIKNNKNAEEPSNSIVINAMTELREEISNYAKKLNEVGEDLTGGIDIEEIHELKSLISGVIVQLNTSLNPNIDLINEKIDKLNEENNRRIHEIEEVFSAKIEAQSKQINALENKIIDFSSKFDKLIEILTEDQKEYAMKDMLNYLVSEISVASEFIKSRQNADESLKKIEQRITSFDTNINKIVSYIEED